MFQHAQRVARASTRPAAATVAEADAARFAEEFAPGPEAGEFRGSSVSAAFARHDGDVATGWGYWYGFPNGVEVHPPEERRNRSGVAAEPALQWTPFDDLAVRVSARNPVGDAEPELGESHVVGEWAGVRLWAGHHAIGYGPGTSGGITLSDGALFAGLGIQSREPFRLPWYLRHIGPVTLDFTLARFDLAHSFDDVAFLATRGSVAPHERLQLGVSRAAMFGGEGNTSVDAFAIFSVLIGKHAGRVSELDNQVVSVDAVYRPPTERWLPVELYVEWGFEDSAGAYTTVPGVLAGIQVPLIPGFPAASVGVEYTHFDESCCGNPIWYRHSTFHDGWVRDGEPLGHPLGGHGQQWTLYGSASLWQSRVRARTQIFHRERLLESLYTPDLLGRTVGVQVGLEWRAAPWLDLSLDHRLETGDDWRESFMQIGLRGRP